MKIVLEDRTDIVGWKSAFRLLAYEPAVRFWGLLGISANMCKHPDYLLKVSQTYLNRDEVVVTPESWISENDRVSELREAHQMVDVGNLYITFGLLLGFYGVKSADNVIAWGERNFNNNKAHEWLEWSSVLYKASTTSGVFQNVLNDKEQNTVVLILNEVLSMYRADTERLHIEFRNFVELYKSDKKHQDNLRNLVLYDFTANSESVSIEETLDSLFNLDLIVFRNFSFHFWHVAYERLDISDREKVFTWGRENHELRSKEIKQYFGNVLPLTPK